MRLVLCQCPSSVAEDIARALVEERLAACVSVAPGWVAHYRWEEAIERAEESALWIKVDAARLDQLRARLVALHPYEVPEILTMAVSVCESHTPYVDWVRAQTAPPRVD